MEVDGGMQEVKIGKRVFVGNLAWRTSWQDLKVRVCVTGCSECVCVRGAAHASTSIQGRVQCARILSRLARSKPAPSPHIKPMPVHEQPSNTASMHRAACAAMCLEAEGHAGGSPSSSAAQLTLRCSPFSSSAPPCRTSSGRQEM